MERTDIEAELRTSIADAVEAKVAGGVDETAAEEAVITELGDPDRLAAGYASRLSHLIGPELFFDYKRLMTVLLVTVVPIVVVVTAIIDAISGEDVGSVIAGAFSVGLSVVVHIGFWTTLVFAVIERSGEKKSIGEWTPSSLPALTTTTGASKLGDTIASIVFLVSSIVALFLSRNYLGVNADDGSLIPVFNQEMWNFWIPLLIAVLAAEIIFEVVKYRVGRVTWSLASVNLAVNVAFAVPAIYLLATEQLLNPAFFEELGWTGAPTWGGTAVMVTVITIAVIAMWDIVDNFRKARRTS